MKKFHLNVFAELFTLSNCVSVQAELLNVTTLDVPGASNTLAYGIDGSNIVGYYIDGSYNYHGFLTVIPEPATLSLLAIGMLMACRRRRLRRV